MSKALKEALSDILSEGSIELTKPIGRQRIQSIDPVNIPQATQMPVLKIGRPQAWAIDELVSSKDLPSDVKSLLKSRRVFVLRLACSFDPQHDEVSLAWAQLTLQLKPGHQGHKPLAFDLFPMAVKSEQKVSKRISLNHKLKFCNVETSSREFAYSFEHPPIEPLLTASGINESTPSWNFTSVPGFPLTGAKLLHAIVTAPRALSHLIVSLALTVDLDYKQRRFSAWLCGSNQTLIWTSDDQP